MERSSIEDFIFNLKLSYYMVTIYLQYNWLYHESLYILKLIEHYYQTEFLTTDQITYPGINQNININVIIFFQGMCLLISPFYFFNIYMGFSMLINTLVHKLFYKTTIFKYILYFGSVYCIYNFNIDSLKIIFITINLLLNNLH